MEGITREDGRPLMLSELIDEVDPIVGYIVEHQVTGRILPTCNRFELYETIPDVIQKMQDVAEFLLFEEDFDIFDYEIVEVRKTELKGGYRIINYIKQ